MDDIKRDFPTELDPFFLIGMVRSILSQEIMPMRSAVRVRRALQAITDWEMARAGYVRGLK